MQNSYNQEFLELTQPEFIYLYGSRTAMQLHWCLKLERKESKVPIDIPQFCASYFFAIFSC